MTEMKTKLADLEEAKHAAPAAYDRFRYEVNSEAREAADAAKAIVEAKHGERLTELSKAKRAAEAAWQAELDASATHEWEGKKVSYERNVGRSWAPKIETLFGVVEVRRSHTRFPSNIYPPTMGAAFVRLMKETQGGSVADESATRKDDAHD